MKRIFLGIILGLIMFILFVYLGGAGYLQKLGKKTEEAGVELEYYEKELKRSAEEVKAKVGKTAEKVKETAAATKEKTIEAVEGAKESVQEMVP